MTCQRPNKTGIATQASCNLMAVLRATRHAFSIVSAVYGPKFAKFEELLRTLRNSFLSFCDLHVNTL